MKFLLHLFCILLVFSLLLFPLGFCRFSVTEKTDAPILSCRRTDGVRPLSVTFSPASLRQSDLFVGLEKAAGYLPAFVKDGAARLAEETGKLFSAFFALLS